MVLRWKAGTFIKMTQEGERTRVEDCPAEGGALVLERHLWDGSERMETAGTKLETQLRLEVEAVWAEEHVEA